MKTARRILKTVLTTSIVCLATVAIAQTPVQRTTTTLPAGSSRTVTKPLPSTINPRTTQQLEYDNYRSGDVKMSPATLTIRYGSDTLLINQGERGGLNIEDTSPLLDSSGKLQATVEYKLKNTTRKDLKFQVGLKYGSSLLSSTEVTLLGGQNKTIRANVKLARSSQYLRIAVEGLNILNYPDDTPPVFMNGALKVMIYTH